MAKKCKEISDCRKANRMASEAVKRAANTMKEAVSTKEPASRKNVKK